MATMRMLDNDDETVLKYVWNKRKRENLLKLAPLKLLRQLDRSLKLELVRRESQ